MFYFNFLLFMVFLEIKYRMYFPILEIFYNKLKQIFYPFFYSYDNIMLKNFISYSNKKERENLERGFEKIEYTHCYKEELNRTYNHVMIEYLTQTSDNVQINGYLENYQYFHEFRSILLD